MGVWREPAKYAGHGRSEAKNGGTSRMSAITLNERQLIRFKKKFKVAGPDECWIWTGSKQHFGHGECRIMNGKTAAHRVAWVLAGNEIPDGLCVLHKCDNPPCVNPAHLFVGTRGDNSRDMLAKGRNVAPRGERCAAAKLTSQQVLEIRRRFGQESAINLGRVFGINRRTVYKLVKKLRWKHLPVSA